MAWQDFWPLPGWSSADLAAGMSGSVFTTDEVLVDVGFDAARRRLGRLAGDGVLLGAAEYAYGAGITGLMQEAGPAAGRSRLAGVRPGDLTETVDRALLGVRWEAIGPDGQLHRPARLRPDAPRWRCLAAERAGRGAVAGPAQPDAAG